MANREYRLVTVGWEHLLKLWLDDEERFSQHPIRRTRFFINVCSLNQMNKLLIFHFVYK